MLSLLTDPTVHVTTNLADGDARMTKPRQKIAGGFRSERGAKEFGVMRSLLSNANRQGRTCSWLLPPS